MDLDSGDTQETESIGLNDILGMRCERGEKPVFLSWTLG